MCAVKHLLWRVVCHAKCRARMLFLLGQGRGLVGGGRRQKFEAPKFGGASTRYCVWDPTSHGSLYGWQAGLGNGLPDQGTGYIASSGHRGIGVQSQEWGRADQMGLGCITAPVDSRGTDFTETWPAN